MPFQPTKILVGTDFSEHARAAADAAGVLARSFGGQLTLLHVVPLSLYMDASAHLFPNTYSPTELQTLARMRVQTEGDQEVARLAGAGISATFTLVDGPPAPEIARVAEAGKFDLVVVGTHGRTGLLHLRLGSVAENVVRLSPGPVLVIRR